MHPFLILPHSPMALPASPTTLSLNPPPSSTASKKDQ
jgi:hypothetical protein